MFLTFLFRPTLNFQQYQDLAMKNPKIAQKFPSIVKIQENGENDHTFTYSLYIIHEKTILLGSCDDVTESELVRVNVQIRKSSVNSVNVNSAGLLQLFCDV